MPICICIVPEGVAYERNTLEEEIPVIHFHLLNYAMEEIQVFQVSDLEKYERLFAEALRLKYENNTGSTYLVTAVLYEILAELTHDVGFVTKPKDNRIITSAEYMRQHYEDPELSIEVLAKQASVSPAYYRREFLRLYGTSPKEYLDTMGINYAKSLLETGYFSQKEIAARCGFLDVGYFRTVFKKKIGKSTKQYLSNLTKNDPERSCLHMPAKPTPLVWALLMLLYAAASNLVSIKTPYPRVGSSTKTWVTAPTSLPFWMIGEPDTCLSSVGQKNFVFFCGFYAFLQVKGRFLHTSPAIPKLT